MSRNWEGDTYPAPTVETYSKLALRSVRLLDSRRFDFMEPEFKARYMEYAVRELALEMQAYVWSKDLETRTIPANGWASWWDHLRADHFPKWMNHRWPPKHQGSIVVKARAIYPELSDQLRPRPILQIVSLDLLD